MALITYNDKSNYQSSSLANEYKVTADDMNEIKSVVNNNYPVSLYNNSSGTAGNVTLSDDISNYSYIEIYFKGNNGSIDCAKVPTSFTTVNLTTGNYYNGSDTFFIQTETVAIGGTTITRKNQKEIVINSGQYPNITTTNLYIVKVVGYK